MRYARLARAVWGLSLLLAPGAMVRTTSGDPADLASVVVARVLGFRHLVQALAIDRAGTHGRLLAGAAIDAAHALGMIGLAVLSGGRRRAAALDAMLAAGLALNGIREARNAR